MACTCDFAAGNFSCTCGELAREKAAKARLAMPDSDELDRAFEQLMLDWDPKVKIHCPHYSKVIKQGWPKYKCASCGIEMD